MVGCSEGSQEAQRNPRTCRQDDNPLMYPPIRQRFESTLGSQHWSPKKPTAVLGEMGPKAVERDD